MKFEKRVSLKFAIILVLVASLVSAGILSGIVYYVYAISPTTPFYITFGGIYPGAPSYTVWKEGSNYFAKDANGFSPTWSGSSNASYVIQSCHDALTNGGIIFLKRGNYIVTSNIIITNPSITILGEGIGDYEVPYWDCGTNLQAASGCTKIIDMQNTRWFTIKDITLKANDIADYCFYADNVNNTAGGEADIYMDNVLAMGVGWGKTNHTIAPVKIWNSIVIRITNCFFHHGYAALWLGSCSDIWVINCDLEGAVVGLLSEFSHHLDIVSVKLEYNVESMANTDYAGTSNAAAIFLSYMDKYVKIQNVIINEFMLHGIRMAADVVSVEMGNVMIHQLPSSAPIGTSYGIWNQGCSMIDAVNIAIWDESGNTDIGIYDQGDNCTWTNIRVNNVTDAFSFSGSGYHLNFAWNLTSWIEHYP